MKGRKHLYFHKQYFSSRLLIQDVVLVWLHPQVIPTLPLNQFTVEFFSMGHFKPTCMDLHVSACWDAITLPPFNFINRPGKSTQSITTTPGDSSYKCCHLLGTCWRGWLQWCPPYGDQLPGVSGGGGEGGLRWAVREGLHQTPPQGP